MDNINLDMLDRLSPVELAGLPPGVLADLSQLLDADQQLCKRRAATLDAAMERKYGVIAYSHRQQKGVDFGTVRFPDGEFVVKADQPKRVKWDQEKLRAALNTMPAEDAAHFAKVEIKVDERKYDAAPASVRNVLIEARTVEPGKASYELLRAAEMAA